MINLRLDGSVSTLILTLRARAEEQSKDDPILNDPWSAEWYAFMPENEKFDEWYNPSFQLASVIRSRLIDEATQAFLDAHDNPLVVELGAGFSTRYFRIGKDKSTWVELDLDEAIIARRKIDISVDEHWFIGADMADTTWVEQLPETDPENILFIAEGTLMFLPSDDVKALMSTLSEQFAGANIIFDVVNPDYIERANSDFEAINAPMQWGIYTDELENYGISVNEIGYLLLENEDRWNEIGVDKSKRTKERSGYVVAATLG